MGMATCLVMIVVTTTIIMIHVSLVSCASPSSDWPVPVAATNTTHVIDKQTQHPQIMTRMGMPGFSDHLLLNTKTDCPTNNAALQCSGNGICLRQKKEWRSNFEPRNRGYVVHGRCNCTVNFIGTGCETLITSLPQSRIDDLLLHGFVRQLSAHAYVQTIKGRDGVPVHSLFGVQHYSTNHMPNQTLINATIRARKLPVLRDQPARTALLDKWTKPDVQSFIPLSRMESKYHSMLRHRNEAKLQAMATNHVTRRVQNSMNRMGLFTNWKGQNIVAPVLKPSQPGVSMSSGNLENLQPKAKLADLLDPSVSKVNGSSTANPKS